MTNHKDYLIRFLQVLKEICTRGISPTVSYDKRDDIWTIHDETLVKADFVNSCQLQILFEPGEIRFEVSRMMKDDSKMIKQMFTNCPKKTSCPVVSCRRRVKNLQK